MKPHPPIPVRASDEVLLCRAFDRARENHSVWHHFMLILKEWTFVPEEPTPIEIEVTAAIGDEYRQASQALDEAFEELCANGVSAVDWAGSLPGGYGEPAGAHADMAPGQGRLRQASEAEEYERQRVLDESVAGKTTGVTWAPFYPFERHGGWMLILPEDRAGGADN